jgi:hypothetical protein
VSSRASTCDRTCGVGLVLLGLLALRQGLLDPAEPLVVLLERVVVFGLGLGFLFELVAESLRHLSASVRVVGGDQQVIQLLLTPKFGVLLRRAGVLGLQVDVALLPIDLSLRLLLGGAGSRFGAGNTRGILFAESP